MIQRNSPTIRREESIEEYSPPPLPPGAEYVHDASPPSQQQHQLQPQHHINYEYPKDQPPVKKSRGRPTKQYWTHEWSDHATEALIELWSEKEELYNKQHPLFYVKENKDRAVEEIRDSLRERGFDVTCNNILSKFQSLRTYFCTQRTKHMAQRRASGATYHMMATDDGSECKWRFYKSLMFLDDNMKPRESHRKMELINAEYCTPPSFAASGAGGGGGNEIMVTRSRPGYTSHHHHPHHHHQPPPPSQTMVEYLHPHEQPSPDGYLNSGNSSGGANSSGNPHNPHHESGSASPYDDRHQQIGPLSSRDYTVSSSYQDGSNDTAKNGGGKHSKSTTAKQDKHEDFIFGELVGNMVHQLPSGKHKDLVKLEIQQLIIKAKYASKNEESEEGAEIKTEAEC